MKLKTYSRSAEIARAGALAIAFIGVGSLAFAFAPGTQVAPTRAAATVAKPTVVAMASTVAIRKAAVAVDEQPSLLAPQMLSNVGFGNPQRSATGELQPTALTAGTPVPAKASVMTKSTLAIGADEADKLYRRAQGLVADGDFAGARLLLERASEAGHSGATFMLAATYDPNVLAKVSALGIKGEPDRAKALYQQALAAGISDSSGRLAALNATN